MLNLKIIFGISLSLYYTNIKDKRFFSKLNIETVIVFAINNLNFDEIVSFV